MLDGFKLSLETCTHSSAVFTGLNTKQNPKKILSSLKVQRLTTLYLVLSNAASGLFPATNSTSLFSDQICNPQL